MTMPQIPEYIIKAHSSRLNMTQRELNLMSAHPNNRREADMWAASFAQRLNEQRFLNAVDWQGQVELVDQQFHARTK